MKTTNKTGQTGNIKLAVTGMGILLTVFLLGCSGATAGSGEGGVFSVSVTGDVNTGISGAGHFMCETVNSGEYNIAASSSLINNVWLSLPDEITAGTHTLETEDSDGSTISAVYHGNNLPADYFDENVSGTLNLTSVPSAPGGRVAGNFSFTAETSGGARSVTVSGDFDFIAGSISFSNCP